METQSQNEVHTAPVTEKVRREYRNEVGVWPIILIVLGLYFLLRNFDILNERILDAVKESWPLLLIWLGIHLATRNNPRMRMLGAIATISILVFIILQTTGAQLPNLR